MNQNKYVGWSSFINNHPLVSARSPLRDKYDESVASAILKGRGDHHICIFITSACRHSCARFAAWLVNHTPQLFLSAGSYTQVDWLSNPGRACYPRHSLLLSSRQWLKQGKGTSKSSSVAGLSMLAVRATHVIYTYFIHLTSLLLRVAELGRGAKCLIRMSGNQTIIDPPEQGSAQDTKRATERKQLSFSFDKSYWSAGPRDEPAYCSQQTLYDDLGKELLDHGFAGFNACILACESSFRCLGAGI